MAGLVQSSTVILRFNFCFDFCHFATLKNVTYNALPTKRNKTKVKKLIFFITILTSCNSKTGDKNNLENSIWKFSDGKGDIGDVLVFSKEHLYVKNDSIYFHNNNSLIGIIDTIKLHYGERRLYVKDLSGNVVRYCEQ